MSNVESIIGQLMDFVLVPDSRIDGISDDQIKQACNRIIFYSWALDGYQSGMLIKRFHFTEEIEENSRQYQDKCMEFE
eukprot:9728929-Ditylum_brightwellii.AAC.1